MTRERAIELSAEYENRAEYNADRFGPEHGPSMYGFDRWLKRNGYGPEDREIIAALVVDTDWGVA